MKRVTADDVVAGRRGWGREGRWESKGEGRGRGEQKKKKEREEGEREREWNLKKRSVEGRRRARREEKGRSQGRERKRGVWKKGEGREREGGSQVFAPSCPPPPQRFTAVTAMYVYYCRTYEKAVSGGGEREKRRTCAKGHH